MSDDPPLLTGVNLYVRDMGASVAFYRLLGLDVDDGHPWSTHHVEVHMPGGTELELDSWELTGSYDSGWQPPAAGMSRNVMIFSCATRQAVDDLYRRMTGAHHAGHQPPFDAFWGARYAVVEDPDGNHIGLMSPADDDHRGAPPDWAGPG